MPAVVADYVAEQLGIDDPSMLKAYSERSQTAYEHAWEIIQAYGYRQFVRHEVAYPTVALKGRNRLFCQPFPTGTCVLRKRGV